MGLIREPLEVDFEFDPRPLTKEEKEKISNYIKEYKAKHSGKQARKNETDRTLTARKSVIA